MPGVRSTRCARSRGRRTGRRTRAPGSRHRHRVDGEVAADQVALEGVAEGDRGLAGVGVVGVGAVGRDLDRPRRPCGSRWCRTRGPCPRRRRPTRRAAARSSSGRAEVVKSRSLLQPAEQRVADRPADQSELLTGVGEPLAERFQHLRHPVELAVGPGLHLHHGERLVSGGQLRHGTPLYVPPTPKIVRLDPFPGENRRTAREPPGPPEFGSRARATTTPGYAGGHRPGPSARRG